MNIYSNIHILITFIKKICMADHFKRLFLPNVFMFLTILKCKKETLVYYFQGSKDPGLTFCINNFLHFFKKNVIL